MTQKDVRKYLKETPDGARVASIALALRRSERSVRATLQGIPDAYIDRWDNSRREKGYDDIWCLAPVPANCPKPERA